MDLPSLRSISAVFARPSQTSHLASKLFLVAMSLSQACALPGEYRQEGALVGYGSPEEFQFAAVSDGSVVKSDIEHELIARGYQLVTLPKVDVRAIYQIGTRELLSISCSHDAQIKQDLASSTALVSCTAIDLSTNFAVYSGLGEYMGRTQVDDVRGATIAALKNFPPRSGKGGRISVFPLKPKVADRHRSPIVASAPVVSGPKLSFPSVSNDYEYDVSGYGDLGYVTGSIEADGSRDVSGSIVTPDGRDVGFEGEWIDQGVVEGYDDDGNFYELEVD